MKKLVVCLIFFTAAPLAFCMQKSTVLTTIDELLLKEAKIKAASIKADDPNISIDSETILRIPEKLALIARNPDLNATDDLGNTRLHYAAFFANFPIINLLLSDGADIAKINNHEQDFLNILTIIINLEHDKTRKHNLMQGYQQLLQTIRKRNPNQRFGDGGNLLHKAVIAQDALLLVSLLAERVINPNEQNNAGLTPLHLAASFSFGDHTIINQLLNHGSNPNVQTAVGNTALHVAVRGFKSDGFTINKLLEYHASTEIYNNEGNTPIHLMLFNLQELIKEYAQMKRSKSKQEISAKFDEVKNAALALFTLLTHTQNKNLQDNFGNTALYYLILFSDAKATTVAPTPEIKELLKPVIEMLFVDKGTNPNVQNREGFTALHAAVGLQDTDLVKLLMDKGASPFIKSFTRTRTNTEIRSGQFPPPNKTPLEMAQEIKKGLPSAQQKALGDIELMLGGENETQPTLLGVGQQQQAPLSREPSPIPQEPSPSAHKKEETSLAGALRNLSRSLNGLRRTLI